LQFLGIDDGIEIHHIADLPARAGLGTSSAFTVGLLLALYALKDQMCDKHSLALDAIRVEQELLQEAVGAQDQVSAAYGGFNRINFLRDGAIEVKRIIAAPHRLAELEQHLALYFTGFSRTASEIAKEQIRVTPRRTNELETMYQMVGEAENIIMNPRRPINEFGKMLHETWKLKRTLTQNVSNTSIDEIYNAGLSSGAVGGKLLGAGGGGFMLFFVPPERRRTLRSRLQNLLSIPFTFSNRGSHVIVYEPEEVYDRSLSDERDVVYHTASRTGAAVPSSARAAGAALGD
jgi:D-glycero-alpha-D-manno-heptose-7-phosphate kinase